VVKEFGKKIQMTVVTHDLSFEALKLNFVRKPYVKINRFIFLDIILCPSLKTTYLGGWL
jgi:hypothetical protein